ncbi:GIY-YIG nuclease family protein [Serratia fonticola]|uniref:GIY-YIG nuclease family protein n=1 Tax=Serratia fonticola TaxID=47917 RepID=UPI0016488B3E|nr:GIY-YIG nuclease family protein [Serratia fonticola]MBC3216696.1 GIY-YIG nuclease family protein [Serratia fonticola]
MSNTYYVYFLKDPRTEPATVFYVGKGTGTRATDHLKKIDNTRKGMYIRDIIASGKIPLISKVLENITEEHAFRIELELISIFGTIDSGGQLYNMVIPKSVNRKVNKSVIVPKGAIEKAQLGLKLLKESVYSLAEENPKGVTNSDCAHYLGLQSEHDGSQRDYLTYSLLGLLKKEGALIDKKDKQRRKYFCTSLNNSRWIS